MTVVKLKSVDKRTMAAYWTIIFTALAVGAAAIWLLFRRNRQLQAREWQRRGLKGVSMRNPLLATFLKKRMELEKDELIKKEGKVWGFTMLNSYTILVADPELVQQVLSNQFTNFLNRRIFKLSDPILGNMLSNAENEQWKRLRQIITPTFSAASLRRMKPRIDSALGKLIDNFSSAVEESGEAIDMKRLYGAMAMETIIHVAFGVKVDSLADPTNPIIVYAKKSFQNDMSVTTFISIMAIILMPGVAEKLGIRYRGDITDFFRHFAEEIISQKKRELADAATLGTPKTTTSSSSSFLELLLEAEEEGRRQQQANKNDEGNEQPKMGKKSSPKHMSTDEMVSQCILFFLAGYETSSSTMCLAAYLLALHPQAQEKLHEEIISVTAQLAAERPQMAANVVELITFEDLPRFAYLSAVVDETLRLYAPATATERQASEDTLLQSTHYSIHVKKGDVVHIPIYSMHRDEEQFEQPEIFKPERFLPTTAAGDKAPPSFHRYSYLPFGGGPRSCVAMSLALREVKLALLHTVRLYKLSPCDRTKIPVELYYQANFITPKDIILKVEKR